MVADLAQHFCLRNGRRSFQIRPEEDGELYFGKKNLRQELLDSLEKTLILDKPPKNVISGDYGIGKTHMLYHVKYHLETVQTSTAVHIVYLEIGDLKKKSGFQHLYSRMMETLGRENVASIMAQYMQTHVGPNLRSELINYFGNENMANATINLGSPGVLSHYAWTWMCGENLNNESLASIGVSRNLKHPADYVNTLRNIGRLFKDIEKKKLIFLIDEVENLGNVTDFDAHNEYEYALRDLSDASNQEVGIIFSITGTIAGMSPDEQPLIRPFVKERMETEGGKYLELPLLVEPGSAEVFIKDLFDKLIDKECAKEKIEKSTLPEKPTVDTYPLTQEALEYSLTKIGEDPTRSKPRTIISALNDLAVETFRRNELFINEALTQDVLDRIL